MSDETVTERTVFKPERALAALIAAAVLAVVHQYLFYGTMPGVSYPIYVCLFYGFMLYFAKDQKRTFTFFSSVWLGAIFLLSLTFAFFYNLFFYGLNLLVVPVLIVLHMTYMLSERRPDWSRMRLAGIALEHFILQSFRHWSTALVVLRGSRGGEVKDERKKVVVKVLTGLVISFPLLLIVFTLLSSADGVFHHVMLELPNILDHFSFGQGFTRTLWIVLLSFGLFGFLWGFVDAKTYVWGMTRQEFGPQLRSVPHPQPAPLTIDPVILTTVLAVINTVYVLYVLVQFSYLFGAWEGVVPEGSTYADYARSGFLELMLVTAINFVILLLGLKPSGKTSGLLRTVINTFLYIMVLCSMVMLYSAYTRLALYEEAYGYTYIRFLVHAFMIFLGLLLVLAAVRIRLAKFPLAKCYIVLGLLSYVLMNYIGMDHIIANKNIERYKASGNLDMNYLTTLSPGTVPDLLEFSRQEGGILDEEMRSKWQDMERTVHKWPSFNLAQFRADRALADYFEP
ncbi:DUF4173 domain-containing protein [Paenibacillus albidus]|uniref:DUF4153 domain-containing protein n=1 Tax=Paenibacillus albidus TaxID=2041023 RepID=UPI001BEA7946|nr:DUF4173 domain-containing protein [Paenibacillus albidus]MBT2291105.1 DUF4173 domain-containing protein [Paenibacillus albidus]